MEWKSLGLLELTALPTIGAERWVPWVREADVLLVDGGDATYLCHWMRQSGLADLLPSLPDTIWVGVSAGSMVMTPRIGDYFVEWPSAPDDRTLGVVDFSIFPHLDVFPTNTLAGGGALGGRHRRHGVRHRRPDRHPGRRRQRRRRLRGDLAPTRRRDRWNDTPQGAQGASSRSMTRRLVLAVFLAALIVGRMLGFARSPAASPRRSAPRPRRPRPIELRRGARRRWRSPGHRARAAVLRREPAGAAADRPAWVHQLRR